MPLDLEPVLDLEPLEEDRPPEREDRPLFSEPPPVLMGKPEVLVEGTTRATIPASLEVPQTQAPKPVVNVEGRTLEPEVLASVEPGEWAFDPQRPLVNPDVVRAAVDIGTATLPRDEFSEGVRRGVTGLAAGMTSPESIAITPAFAVPFVGPALAMGLGAKSLGAGAGRAVGGIESGDPGEVAEALVETGMGGLMALGGAGGAMARPAPIPPRILETIVKHGETLPKAAAAVTKAVTKEQPKEVTSASSQPKAAEIHGDVRPLEKPAEVVPAQESSAGIQPRAGEPPRAEGGAQGEVLLKPEVVRRIESMPDAEAAKLSQRGEQYEGLNLTPADVPALEAARVASGERIQTLFAEASKPDATPESQLAAQAELGRNIWLSGAIETANKKGPNYAAAQTAKAVQQSAPVDTARVAGVPEKLPAAEAPVAEVPPAAALDIAPTKALSEKVNTPEGAPRFVGDVPIVREMVSAAQRSAAEMRGDVSAVRYGKPGEILFEFRGKTYSAKEPKDVMPARDAIGINDPASQSWALKQILDGKANEVAPEALTPEPAARSVAGQPEVAGAKAAAKPIESMTLEEAQAAAAPIYAKLEAIPEDKIFVAGSRGERLTPEYKALSDQVKPYARRIEVLQNDIRAAEIKAQNERAFTAKEKRIREAPVYQRRNGWEIVKEMAQYALRDPFTKEDIYIGPLRRVREVANESKPEPPTPQAQPFFERESEVAGLGRSSLPPTVADIRAQRAFEARQRAAEAAKESGFVPDTRGETVKMRKSAARATESPMIPEAVQERIRTAEESQYRQQAGDKVEDAVKAMSDAQLSAIPPDSNLFVAARLERAVRDFAKGEMDAGYNVFVELEKQGTSFGQNVNQFKRLEGAIPEYVAFVIDKKLKAAGKDPLTPEQQATAIETARAAKAADASLDAATRAWEKQPTAENAAKAESALDASNAAAVELQKFVAKFEPRSTASILKSVLQGNLLTPISEVANIVGNMSFLPFRALDRTIASGLDIIDSAVRGKPRELAVQPLAGTAEALKGVARGAAKIPEILAKGTGNVIKGETRAGLHPVQAWINQFAKNPEMPTTGGKLTLKDRLNLAIEGTFGMSAEAMLRGLGSGDAPFKEGARARVTAEQLRLADVPRDQWPFAQKFPELFLGKRALDQIHKDTLAAVFQGESKALNYLTNLAKSRGEVMDLMVATVAPYKLTPWNIVSEILSYNPLVAMLKGVNDVRKGDTRNAKLNAGKLVVGSMLTGAGIWLYKNGLLAPSLDERNEAQKARVLSGQVLPPNHINISGLERAMKGGEPAFQPGDETRDVFRAGGLAGSIFYMTANIGRDMERGPEVTDSDMWMSIIRQSTLEQARFGLNQSFLSGIEGLLTAVKEGKGDNFLRQWMNTVTSIPLPNTLNTISRASREYQVDTKGDLGAQFKSKLGLAGLDDYLPLKRDLWGQPIPETPEGREAFFYHVFDITKGRQVTSDPVPLELYRLWRKTGDNAAIPSIPERNTTVAKTTYALEPAQYERYAELVGGSRREIVDALVINPEFHKLNDEQKLKVLSRAYDAGLERGKGVFYQEFQGKLTPKAGRSGFR